MSIPKVRKALGAGLTVGVLSVGLIVPALAQDVDDTDTSTAQSGDHRTDREAAFAAALAAELGLDEDTVADALATVRAEHRGEQDDGGRPGRRGGPGHHGFGRGMRHPAVDGSDPDA